MKKGAFTMIELIFVIVILGILAAVAIPKLAATRDDAKMSTEITNLSTAINDIGSYYTSRGTINVTSAASIAVTKLKCFSTAASGAEGITVSASNAGTTYCATAHTQASNKGLSGDHKFGGTGVSY